MIARKLGMASVVAVATLAYVGAREPRSVAELEARDGVGVATGFLRFRLNAVGMLMPRAKRALSYFKAPSDSTMDVLH